MVPEAHGHAMSAAPQIMIGNVAVIIAENGDNVLYQKKSKIKKSHRRLYNTRRKKIRKHKKN